MTIKDRLREIDRAHAGVATVNHPTSHAVTPPATTDLFPSLFRTSVADQDNSRGGGAASEAGDIQALCSEGCLVIEHQAPLTTSFADFTLDDLRNLSTESIAIVGKDERLSTITLRNTLFIDTETTGLAGGAGTVAFLVGVGYLTETAFVVRQYFMRDFHEETALLNRLAQQVEGASGLVSFNGRAFDVPLLNSRYIIHRRRAIFDGLPHFDVLFAARRVWRDSMNSCALGELERNILGIERREDVPGALVPQIYFDYLHSGKIDGLRGVFLHNRHDIISMAALLIRLCRMVNDPFIDTTSRERRQLATLFRKVRRHDRSAMLFEELIHREQSAQSIETFVELAICYRRLQRYDDICRLWQSAIERLNFHPLPFIELAKHYEHRLNDIESALVLTERALRALRMRAELNSHADTGRYLVDLEKRWQRLLRKK
jgi:hypothetical protein